MRKSDFEDDPLLGPAGLVFQTSVRPKKAKAASEPRAMRLSGAQIARVIRRRPEVMVKVTGSARGFRSLKEHLAYITRNGKILGERENGELILGAANVRSLAEDWWWDCCRGRNPRARDTINIILSMPPGTDPQVVADAAQAFAQNTFGAEYDYLLAHHNRNTDPQRPENPHAHLTIKTRGRYAQWLNPRKADLQDWREKFAAELRKRGVVAEATPRRVRGVVRKGQRQAIRHMDARRASRVTQWKLQQAIKTLVSGEEETFATAKVKAAKDRQRKICRAWNTLAVAFEAAGQRALALEIKQFVGTMRPASTEREHLVEQAQQLFQRRQIQEPRRGRER